MFKLMIDMAIMFGRKTEKVQDAEPSIRFTKRRRSSTKATELPDNSTSEPKRGRTLSPSRRSRFFNSRYNRHRIPEPRSPSPCPFSTAPPPAEMEPFPDFTNEYASLDLFDPHHCVLHCAHQTCKKLRKMDAHKHIAPKPCIRSKNGQQAPPTVCPPYNLSRIQALTRKNIAATKRAYGRNNKTSQILVELTSAIAIVEKLRDEKRLDFCSHLLKHPDYTLNTVYKPSQYRHAAHAADALVDKLLGYLRCMLSQSCTHTRYVTIAELEQEMRDVMHLEVLWWSAEWCLCKVLSGKDSEGRRDSMLREAMVKALIQREEGKQTKGVNLVMGRANEVVKRVMGALMWWNGMTRGVDIDKEDFEGSVGSCESEVDEWHEDALGPPSDGSNHEMDVKDGHEA